MEGKVAESINLGYFPFLFHVPRAFSNFSLIPTCIENILQHTLFTSRKLMTEY